MTTNLDQELDIIQSMVHRIVEHVKPVRIILFGSRAKGMARPDSDVDLLIVMPSGHFSRTQKAAEIYSFLGGVGLSKDIVVVTEQDIIDYHDIDGTVIKPALQEGKTLYDRAA